MSPVKRFLLFWLSFSANISRCYLSRSVYTIIIEKQILTKKKMFPLSILFINENKICKVQSRCKVKMLK